MSKYIYLDHAAATPAHKSVIKAMKPYWNKQYGNSSSTHQYGQRASAAITKVRKEIADFFYCTPEEIIFTSGATESNNTAIKGVMRFYGKRFANKGNKSKPHMILSAIEHPSVIETALALERENYEISIVKPNKDGEMEVKDIIKEIKDNTVLISMMYVNNETGIIQPSQELGKKLLEINKDREDRIYYHIDAVQGFSYLNCRPDHLKADLMSFSGHKIYGPKGIGILYIRDKTPLFRLMDGGHQERAIRGGTNNTTGIIGLGQAIKLHIKNTDKDIQHIRMLADCLYAELKSIPNLRFNSSDKSIPGILNIAIKDIVGSDLQMKLDLAGFATSMGAACASGSAQPSPVLIAMNQSDKEASEGIRISLGKQNTLKDMKKFVKTLGDIINNWNNE
ncbi:MAG: cysteine desulfurase family protein [Candidatus Komeilibacteria bacterium]